MLEIEEIHSSAVDVDKSYHILDRAVSSGFDYIGVELLGHKYVLKTLTSLEEEAIRIRSYGSGSHGSICWVLSFGTYMVDGKDYLSNRWTTDNLDTLYALYSGMPYILVTALHSALLDLSRRLDQAYNMFQGYMFSQGSRSRWITFSKSHGKWGLDMRLDSTIGTSIAREYWVRGNSALDSEEEASPGWDQALFLASAQNPKGAKESASKKDGRKKMIDEERETLSRYGSLANRDIILKIVKHERWTAPLATQQDILDELFRQMRGERDKHDLFVNEYMVKQAERRAAAENVREAEAAEYRRKLRESRAPREEGQREASAEEVEALFGGKNAIKVTGKRVLRSR